MGGEASRVEALAPRWVLGTAKIEEDKAIAQGILLESLRPTAVTWTCPEEKLGRRKVWDFQGADSIPDISTAEYESPVLF